MTRQKSLLTSVIALLAVLALFAGCAGEGSEAASGSDQSAKVGGRPGEQAPDFALTNLAGETVRLSDFSGNVVLVDFWATWCGPCKLAMPHLQEIHEKYADHGVTIVAVSVDAQGAKVVRPFIQKTGYTFEVVMTDKQVEKDFGGFRGIPTTFVIGPDGKVFKRFTGYQDKSVYLNAIKALKPEITS